MANLLLLALAAAILCTSLVSALPRDLALTWDESGMNNSLGSPEKAKPVNVTLYYESLCPYCKEFIYNQVIPVWMNVKDTGLMTLTLRPYGNAQETKQGDKWKFTCQHGPKECEGNILEVCIIHYHPNTTKQLEILTCVELEIYRTQDWEGSLYRCASTGVDVQKVRTCAAGPVGNRLQHEVAMATGPHSYVPWCMINGKASKAAIDDLQKAVCQTYKGKPPRMCTQ